MKKLILLFLIFPFSAFAWSGKDSTSSSARPFPVHFNFYFGEGACTKGFSNEGVELSASYRHLVFTSRFYRSQGSGLYFFEDAVTAGWKADLPHHFGLTLSSGYSDLAFEKPYHFGSPEFDPANYNKSSGWISEAKLDLPFRRRDHSPSAWGASALYYMIVSPADNIWGYSIGLNFDPVLGWDNLKHPVKEPRHVKHSTDVPAASGYVDNDPVQMEWQGGVAFTRNKLYTNWEISGIYRKYIFSFATNRICHIAPTIPYENGRFNRISRISFGRRCIDVKSFSLDVLAGYSTIERTDMYAWLGARPLDGFSIGAKTNYIHQFKHCAAGASAGYTLYYPTVNSAPHNLGTFALLFIPAGETRTLKGEPKKETPFHFDINAMVGEANHRGIFGGTVFFEYRGAVLGIRSTFTEPGWKGSMFHYNFYREYSPMAGYRIHSGKAWITLAGGFTQVYLGDELLYADRDNVFSHLFESPNWYNGATVQLETAFISPVHHVGWGMTGFVIFDKYSPVYGFTMNLKLGKLH